MLSCHQGALVRIKQIKERLLSRFKGLTVTHKSITAASHRYIWCNDLFFFHAETGLDLFLPF